MGVPDRGFRAMRSESVFYWIRQERRKRKCAVAAVLQRLDPGTPNVMQKNDNYQSLQNTNIDIRPSKVESTYNLTDQPCEHSEIVAFPIVADCGVIFDCSGQIYETERLPAPERASTLEVSCDTNVDGSITKKQSSFESGVSPVVHASTSPDPAKRSRKKKKKKGHSKSDGRLDGAEVDAQACAALLPDDPKSHPPPPPPLPPSTTSGKKDPAEAGSGAGP